MGTLYVHLHAELLLILWEKLSAYVPMWCTDGEFFKFHGRTQVTQVNHLMMG
jgi:hypothetical protein